MTCDTCNADLEPGYVPEVDAAGRHTQAVCPPCKLAQIATAVYRRSAREASRRDLMDEFADVLRREITPRLGN